MTYSRIKIVRSFMGVLIIIAIYAAILQFAEPGHVIRSIAGLLFLPAAYLLYYIVQQLEEIDAVIHRLETIERKDYP